RSMKLLERRNEKILHRYYYYSRLLHYKYEFVITALSEDFDLSESTLIQLIEDNTNRLMEIAKNELTAKKLKKMFPSYDWSGSVMKPAVVKAREVYDKY